MVCLAVLLTFLAWIGSSDACSPGLGLDQLRSTSLVGQMSNLSRDDPTVGAVNFAANVDPLSQTMSVNQLACTIFDNRCPWRTSNLSTIPWFQSNYKFDQNVLKYATGTDVQPDDDYAIAVSQMPNRTDYAVLESPAICQVGNGYLQLLLWASQGVRVQACSKAVSASSFDFCTLFMTENQPGPYSIIVPPSSQMPLKIYIVATNFNYTDNNYAGGFSAIDQIAYSGTDCSASQTTTSSSAIPSVSTSVGAQGSSMFLSSISTMMSTATSSTPTPTTPPITLSSLLTPSPTSASAAALRNAPLILSPPSLATELKNVTEMQDVSITPSVNDDSTAVPKQQSNYSTFYLSGGSDDVPETSAQTDNSGSGSAAEARENLIENSGFGSGDNETDSDMVAAKTDDELDGSGLGNSPSDDAEGDGSDFVFNLPEDVTASPNANDNSTTTIANNPTTTSASPPTTTIQSPMTTTGMMSMNNMPMNYVVDSNNQPIAQKTEPRKSLPERIQKLLYNTSTNDQEAQPPKQPLVKQLYNNRKSAIEANDEPESPKDQEDLPGIFHPSANRHPRPQQKPPPTTTQPPWYEFTTLYPGQRRAQATVPSINFYPTQQSVYYPNQLSVQQQTPQPFVLNPQQWIDTANIQTQRTQK